MKEKKKNEIAFRPGESFLNESLLLLTALIWGGAFVAQKAGMDHVSPFTYNAIRFFLGSLSLLPLLLLRRRNKRTEAHLNRRKFGPLTGGIYAGLVLFGGATLQQVGLVYTTAGNAGFITSLYVIIVPLLGLFWGIAVRTAVWIGCILAGAGLYLLAVGEGFTMTRGDIIVFAGAFFWAFHVIVLSQVSPGNDPALISILQFGLCAVLSLIVALVREIIDLEGIIRATVPIIYGGVVSVGIAYTLQVAAQRKVHPARAAIILSLESLFAAFGGWLLLDETMTLKAMAGGLLLLTGVIVSQKR